MDKQQRNPGRRHDKAKAANNSSPAVEAQDQQIRKRKYQENEEIFTGSLNADGKNCAVGIQRLSQSSERS